MIAIDLSKQKGLVADPKAIKQMHLLQILIEMEMPQCYLLLKKQETIFDFSQGTVIV